MKFCIIFGLLLTTACSPYRESNGLSQRKAFCSSDTVNQFDTNIQRAIGSYPASSAPSWSAHLAIRILHPENESLIIGSGLCSGVLVSPFAVITAAHCLQVGLPIADGILEVEIKLGGKNRYEGESFVSRNFSLHPDYALEPLVSSDVAIIWLPSSANSEPVRLASQEFIDHAILNRNQNYIRILGYGKTNAYNKNSTTDYLQEIIQELRSFDYCKRYAPKDHPYHSKYEFICTASRSGETTSTCGGDSGGPLIVNTTSGEPIVVGITSFGPETCVGLSYATNLAKQRQWIENTIYRQDIFIEATYEEYKDLLCFYMN